VPICGTLPFMSHVPTRLQVDRKLGECVQARGWWKTQATIQLTSTAARRMLVLRKALLVCPGLVYRMVCRGLPASTTAIGVSLQMLVEMGCAAAGMQAAPTTDKEWTRALARNCIGSEPEFAQIKATVARV